MTVAEILNDIRKKTNLHCYFIGKVLYCGNVYSEKVDTEKVKIVLERNAVSQDLNETNGEFQVKVVSIGAGGKKLEAKAGTEGSEVYNLTYNEKGKTIKVEDLKKFAEDFMKALKNRSTAGVSNCSEYLSSVMV